jgi:hypothetical protein
MNDDTSAVPRKLPSDPMAVWFDRAKAAEAALEELVAALDQHEVEWAVHRIDAAVAAARIVLARR